MKFSQQPISETIPNPGLVVAVLTCLINGEPEDRAGWIADAHQHDDRTGVHQFRVRLPDDDADYLITVACRVVLP